MFEWERHLLGAVFHISRTAPISSRARCGPSLFLASSRHDDDVLHLNVRRDVFGESIQCRGGAVVVNLRYLKQKWFERVVLSCSSGLGLVLYTTLFLLVILHTSVHTLHFCSSPARSNPPTPGDSLCLPEVLRLLDDGKRSGNLRCACRTGHRNQNVMLQNEALLRKEGPH